MNLNRLAIEIENMITAANVLSFMKYIMNDELWIKDNGKSFTILMWNALMNTKMCDGNWKESGIWTNSADDLIYHAPFSILYSVLCTYIYWTDLKLK